nr:hypothetical protein BaRGS_014583 [Batillaria attramentaria]
MALAVTDLLLLYLSLLPRWIGEQFGHWLTDKNEASCKALSWLEYSFTSLSAWLLSAMTAQRAVSIVWPARSRAVSAWKQAALTTVVLTVASFAFNSSVLYGMTKQESCWWEYHFQRNALHVLQLVEIFLNSIIPSLVMVVCNCFMIRAVMLSADHRPSSGEDPQAGLAPSRVTLTLIVVSLVFIVLTLPMYVTQIVLRGNSELDGHGPFQIWYNVTSVMWITNSVVNFFLYVMTSPRFREEGKRLLGKARPTSDHAGSGTETEMARLNTTLV